MRLDLHGANPAEWLALRLGLVPTVAAQAWTGMGLSGIVVAAVRTGVTERLARGPATVADLASELGLDPVPTQLMLHCLRSSGHVTGSGGVYRLSRSSRRWLDPRSDRSVSRYVAGTADYWDWWSGLAAVTRTGKVSLSHDAAADDPYWRRYIYGQLDLARLSAREVARKIRLSGSATSLLDVGGGHGWYSAAMCQRHRGLTATVLDLPGSTAIGREIIAAAGMSDRVRYRDGDATLDDLGGGYDAVLCFNLVHHLTAAQIVALFGRIRESLVPGGTLAVMDVFAEPASRASAAADFLAMFVYLSSGAQVHTPAELRFWLREAGFPGPPRRIRILRIPGQALYLVRK